MVLKADEFLHLSTPWSIPSALGDPRGRFEVSELLAVDEALALILGL